MGGEAARRATEFGAVFAALKRLLQRHADKLSVKAETADEYYLETRSASYKGARMFFGAVRAGGRYVSFYLMPVYVYPDLLVKVSPALRKRMQGKSCFNFTKSDPELFAELEKLVDAGFRRFEMAGLL